MSGEPPLPAALSGYPEPFTDEAIGAELAQPAWHPTDDAGAEWAMRKLAETMYAARPIAEQAQAWRERVDEWERHELATFVHRASFFQRLLETYGLEQRAESGGKRKTVTLPSGTISTRGSEEERLVITDRDAFIDSLRDAPPQIRDALLTVLPKPITELRRVLTTYQKVACQVCGVVQVILEHHAPAACGCGGGDGFVLVETVYGVPRFGLVEPEDEASLAGAFLVAGVGTGPPPTTTASVALVDERALPR